MGAVPSFSFFSLAGASPARQRLYKEPFQVFRFRQVRQDRVIQRLRQEPEHADEAFCVHACVDEHFAEHLARHVVGA